MPGSSDPAYLAEWVRAEERRWADLYERLEKAATTLEGLVNGPIDAETHRLLGKIEGVKLAIEYMAEFDRG